jgi:hypothetical protein
MKSVFALLGLLLVLSGCSQKQAEAHVLFVREKDRISHAGSYQPAGRDLNTCFLLMNSATVWREDVAPRLKQQPARPAEVRASLRMHPVPQPEGGGNSEIAVTFTLAGAETDDLAAILRLMIDAVNARLGPPYPFVTAGTPNQAR